jgi:hypothetical protein
MDRNVPTFTQHGPADTTTRIQPLWTEYAYVGAAGPAAPYRTVALATYQDGRRPHYTVVHRDDQHAWTYLTPRDLDHKQMETWQTHRQNRAAVENYLWPWLDVAADWTPATGPRPIRLFHHAGDLRPIAEIPTGSWIYDDINDEAALFHGWSQRESCYIASWTSGGDFCLFDLDGNRRPQQPEVLCPEYVAQQPACAGPPLNMWDTRWLPDFDISEVLGDDDQDDAGPPPDIPTDLSDIEPF